MRKVDARGVTLVELLIAIVVTGILVAGVIGFTVGNLSGYTAASIRENLLAQAQTGLNRINDSILLAGAADATNRIADSNGPGGPSNLYGWTGSNQTLILATAAQDSAGNILFSDPANYVSYKNNLVYYLDGTTLKQRTLASSAANNKAKTSCPPAKVTASCPADAVVLENVKSFSVTYLDKNNASVTPGNARGIEINVTMNDKRYTKKTQITYTTRSVFRND